LSFSLSEISAEKRLRYVDMPQGDPSSIPPVLAATSDLAGQADLTHVLFNNCYRDWAHVNAQQLTVRLGAP